MSVPTAMYAQLLDGHDRHEVHVEHGSANTVAKQADQSPSPPSGVSIWRYNIESLSLIRPHC